MAWISLPQAGKDKSTSMFYTLNLPPAAKQTVCMARINGSDLT
jgi:hypothetical protein